MEQKVLLGVTGGIAAYKALELIKSLKSSGHAIKVILTRGAASLSNIEEFKKVTKGEVYTEQFGQDENMPHIQLAEWADIFVIVPATANVISKITHGIADDLLTTAILVTNVPILICPAMNCHMWEKEVIQENVQLLKKRGFQFVDPEYGDLACGYKGIGRLATTSIISEKITQILKNRLLLKGKKILITAGGTQEPIDAARVITNKSSGQFGFHIAQAAQEAGAQVLLIRSKASSFKSGNIPEITFETAGDLENILKKEVPHADIIIHAAAVSDFSVKDRQDTKIKSGQEVTIELVPTPKIINQIKKYNQSIFLVGFKAERTDDTKNLIRSAEKLLQQSQADLIVANDLHTAGKEETEVYIISKNKHSRHIARATKQLVARQLIELITQKTHI